MKKHTISTVQQIFLVFMFILGNSIVLGVNIQAKNDTWISIILAVLIFLPFVCIYARILKLFPEKSIFDIMEILYGKIFSKLFIVLFTWYAIHLCALIVRNFAEYIKIVAMPETPSLIVMITLLLVTMYLARSNIRTLGEWSFITGTFVLIMIALTIVLELKDMEVENVLPILGNGYQPILTSSFQIISFPFAEIVVILALGGSIANKENPYKIFTLAIIISGTILVCVFLRNIFMLGMPMCEANYFPSFTASRLIEIGDFLSRIEGTISVNLLFAGITKITVCLICSAKGISKLFNINNYQDMVLCTSLLVLALCVNLFKNVMEMFAFIKYYPYYALLFQAIIPILIWLSAEYRHKKHKNKTVSTK